MKLSMDNVPLDLQYRNIALEAQAGESSLQQAVTRLPEFLKATTKKLVDALSHPIDALFPAKNLHWAVNQLVAVPYPQMRSVEVPCVPGIKVDYRLYTERLADDAKLCKRMEEDYLDPLIDYIARKLSHPDGLKSAQPDDTLSHISMKDLNAHNNAISKCIDAKHGKVSKPYGQIVKRNADWPEILAHSQTIHLAFSQVDHDRFKAKVDRANNLLATLIQRLTQDRDAYKVSSAVLGKVVEVSYVVATAVEYYGMTYRRALILDNALDQLIVQVSKKAA
jgi:hypothetical protein